MTKQQQQVYEWLCRHRDGMTETTKEGEVWASVCATDIDIQGIRPTQIGGYLAALQEQGLYRKTSKYFGLVRVTE